MARVSIPGVGDFERQAVMAPWGGEEFVRYVALKLVTLKAGAVSPRVRRRC
jgi:hypothetical protein